ncbi:hypothetical protein G9A89_020554 [Geosiphon pyriformis]|nr:hypothetical protein G9A89_020554 [Geosiphon pyriformis]
MSEKHQLYHLIKSLNLEHEDSALPKKACQFFQEINAKNPHSTLTSSLTCKLLICIQLACESLGISYNRKNLLNLSQITPSKYNATLDAVKSFFKLGSLTFEALGVQFGCQMVVEHAEVMFEFFQTEWVKSLSAGQREKVDWNKNVHKMAVFWCCCKALGIRISKDELLACQNSCSNSDLNTHIKFVESNCKSLIEDLRSQNKGTPIKSPSKKSSLAQKASPKTPTKRSRKSHSPQTSGSTNKILVERKNNQIYEEEYQKESYYMRKRKYNPFSFGEMIANDKLTREYQDYLNWRKEILMQLEYVPYSKDLEHSATNTNEEFFLSQS